MSSSSHRISKAVASAATATVDGYLRNMSKRQRIPAAEGGRGTRRKMAMVTSASVTANVVEESSVVGEDASSLAADVDEWDEVELPVAPPVAKKQEDHEELGAVKSYRALDGEEGGVKGEPALGASVVKGEAIGAQRAEAVEASSSVVKAELVIVDAETVSNERSLMEGAQMPLVGQPRSSDTWRQRDPAYEAMIEQRDLLAAQRRSQRIQRVCESLFLILAVFVRARLLWREACHPRFVRRLLRLRVSGAAAAAAAKRARHEEPSVQPESRFVFLRAVVSAKALAAEAAMPQHRKPSLAPAWVTCTRDAVQNKTSTAVKVLLNALNAHFKLVVPSVTDASASGDVAAGGAGATAAEPDFSDWSASFSPRFLGTALTERRGRVAADAPVELPHPLYFSLIFLALARAAGLSCRLVVAKVAKTPLEQRRTAKRAGGGAASAAGNTGGDDEVDEEGGSENPSQPLQPLSIFHGREKRKAADHNSVDVAATGAKGTKRSRSSAEAGPRGAAAGEERRSKKLPTSCYWAEVWSPEREGFLSVNPNAGCATLWGASYTLSVSGHAATDATPRYISKYSAAYAYGRRLGTCQQHRFLWHDEVAWDDNRELSEVLRITFNVPAAHTSALAQRQLLRESRQLHSLMYSEAVPTTLNALHHHPLYVIETDLARHEGVHPKDASTTVGSVKGHMVYKRSAIVSLRSRDGWLREGRSLLTEDQQPYKIVPPPASRPFATPSAFYGRWQTRPFEPLPLVAGDPPSIPHHGRTSWYILLDKPPPPGIVHMTQPQISRVARRMKLDFGMAAVGFVHRRTDEHRRGRWETVLDGIVVKQTDSMALQRAYEEWVQLVQEQEAAKRRQRAFHWWLLLAQRLLALKRLQDQYVKGVAAGAMPIQ
ncbi:DNA-repair protein [Novymonas esmeraldas]|uniref:DNA-repair protein n=1 Tax=Novymonas esmeraldas TaxID=1808958 RepID=A0AAW0F6F6_9TRYP